MSEGGGPDAMGFVFAGIVRGQHEVWTMGMHVLGLRGIVMQRKGLAPVADAIIEVIRYAHSSENRSTTVTYWRTNQLRAFTSSPPTMTISTSAVRCTILWGVLS